MDLNKQIEEQLKNAKKLISEVKVQNGIFEKILQETVKGVDDSQKPEVEKLSALAQRSINLAKQGKSEEAKSLIKEFETQWQSKS